MTLQTASRSLRWNVGDLFAISLFGIAYYLAYTYAMSFGNAVASTFWFPDPVFLCALVLVPPRKWWLYLLIPLLIRLVLVPSNLPASFLWATYANDAVKAMLAASLLKHFLKDPTHFETTRDFLLFVAFAVLLGPTISAFEGAATRYLLGYPFWSAWTQWLLGDILANLILAPTILYWLIGGWTAVREATARSRIEALLAAAGLSVASWLAFNGTSAQHSSPALLYAPVPFLLWIAMRFGLRGTSLALTTIALFTTAGATRGGGPFMDISHLQKVTQIQLFLILISLPSLLLAVITGERRQAENSLRDANDRNEAMLKAVPDLMFLLTKDGVYLDYHTQNPHLLFRPPEAFMYRNLRQILPGPLAEEFLARFEEVCRTGEIRVVEYSLDLEGENRCFEARIVPSGAEKVMCVVRDITEYQEAEKALRQTEQRYREVVETQTDLVCRILPDTTLTFVNEACCRFVGRKREELIGRRFLGFIPKSLRKTVMQDVAILCQKTPMLDREYEVTLRNGTIVWQHWVIYALMRGDGEQIEFQAIGRDTTDRKRAEEAQQHLAHASRLAAVGELTAIIAHEVNQPLAAIMSNTEAAEKLLEREAPPMEEFRQILADIRRDDLRAAEAIQRIRRLVRKRRTEMQSLDVNEVSADVVELVAGDALRRRIDLHQDFEPGLPPVRGDRVHLQHVLLNLMVNAMDAMKSNEATQARRLILRTANRGDRIEISVTDTGHGIPPDRLPRIFDSFFTTKEAGMGIGLSIARSIVEAHDGRIWAENIPGGGVIFRVELPVIGSVRDQSRLQVTQENAGILHPAEHNGSPGGC